MKTFLKEEIENKLTTFPPLFVVAQENEIVLELKPYLQPFEKILAFAEIKPLFLFH